MESELLSELSQIRWLLTGLLILGVIFFVFSMIKFIVNWIARRNTVGLRMRDIKIAEAQMYESKGQLPEFLKISTELVELFPEDILANWYFAISNYKNNHLGIALSAFGCVKEIDAAWCKETVDEYIAEIKSEMNGAKSV